MPKTIYNSLDYIETGKGNPIVLIPGMEGTKEFWKHQMDTLGAKYRTIAVSYANFRPRFSRTIKDYSDGVIQIMNHLGISHAAIVGESFGGAMAQEIAIENPERVDALVLCNTAHQPKNRNLGVNMFTLTTLLHPLAYSFPKMLQKPYLNWVGKHRGFVFDQSPGNPQLSEYIMAHGLKPGIGGYLDRVIAGSKLDNLDRLKQIQAPTLVLRGAEDKVVDPDTIVQLVGRIPQAELAIIDGGGHCCQYSMPAETNKALLEWLGRIDY